MKTIERIAIAGVVVACGAVVGCAAPAGDLGDEGAAGESAAAQSEALFATGGGSGSGGGQDPEECMAMLYGCYQSCAKSGSPACYHNCDRTYELCRGLPPSGLVFGSRLAASEETTAPARATLEAR
jgi:hypothetical protein